MGARSTKRPVSQWGHSTLVALSDALGVHRNWPGELLNRGAPGGPPFCELTWRVWMAAHGHEAKKAPEAELLKELANAGIPAYRKLLLGDQAEQQEQPNGKKPEGQTAITWDERKEKAEALRAEHAEQQSAIELGIRQKRIITIDDLHRLVAAIGRLWQPLMHQVPDACLDAANRTAVEKAITDGQVKLTAGMEQQLLMFLEELARGS